MLCCFAALLCCCFAALLLCCFTAVLLCGHRSKSFSVGVLWLTALVFTGLNFLKLWCGQGCCFLIDGLVVVLVCLGLRSTLSLWFCLLAIEHIPKFHVGIMAFVFVIRNFRFHLAHVKIMLELDSGFVLGPVVHRISNIFCDSLCWLLNTFQNFMLESWLYFFWFEISGSTWSMWKSCSSLILDWCWALGCIGIHFFSGFFMLYRFCLWFHGCFE